MMGLDFFRRAIELERQYARPGQRILNTIQTNGTLLDDEWGEFLKRDLVLVEAVQREAAQPGVLRAADPSPGGSLGGRR